MATAKPSAASARAVRLSARRGSICVRVGQRIKELRFKKGWTQQMLADHAEIERAHLARLEVGEREAGLLILERIAEALEIEPADLLR